MNRVLRRPGRPAEPPVRYHLPGFLEARREYAQKQWVLVRQLESSRYGHELRDEAARTLGRPADPGWPPRMQAAWESYRQLRWIANSMTDAGMRFQDGCSRAWTYDHLITKKQADQDAEDARYKFLAAKKEWQGNPYRPADHADPEAGE